MGVVIFAMFWYSDSAVIERLVPILPLLFQMKAQKGWAIFHQKGDV